MIVYVGATRIRSYYRSFELLHNSIIASARQHALRKTRTAAKLAHMQLYSFPVNHCWRMRLERVR